MSSSIDTLWVIFSASLVFLMQAGFLCLEAGSTRRKNNINVAVKNIADLGLSVIVFWAIGYGLMFGTSAFGWAGGSQFFPELGLAEGWPVVFFLFQAMFCSTAVTILSGAIAGRMTFRSYLIIAILISGLLYPVFGHWAWAGLDQSTTIGWLGKLGFVDFAGSTVVHSLGGWAALAAVLVVGPRTGRFSSKRQHDQIPSSDIPLAFLGTLLLWFGWFGFNGGSALAFNVQVPSIIVNTLFAGAAGLLAPLMWLLARQREVAVSLVMNGVLAGLVGITASCHAVSSVHALVIGAISGVVMIAVDWLLGRCHIDDAVGAIPVHLGAGIWGTLAVGLFGDLARLGTGLSRMAQIQAQLSGIFACSIWAFTLALICFLALNRVMPLRVTRKQEYVGLNVAEHGAASELQDLYDVMKSHVKTGDLQRRATSHAFTEIGQISGWYNQVVQSLEHSIVKTEAIVTTAVDGILTVNPRTLLIRSTNPAIEKIFGYSWLGLIGQPLTQLIGPDLKQRKDVAIEALHSLLEMGCHTGDAMEAIGFHEQGRRFAIEITATASRVGTEQFWTLIIRDVTIRKVAEAALQDSELMARQNANQLKNAMLQLQQTQAQLLQSERMSSLGNLVAGMAHEINNPVSFIHGNLAHASNYVQDLLHALELYQTQPAQLSAALQGEVDALDVDFLREDFPRLMSSMQNGTARIRDIVQSLRQFAHYDEADFGLANLNEGLDNTLIMLSHTLKATRDRPAIQICKDYGDLPIIECYAGALNQVFLHILSNAVEALSLEVVQSPDRIITITTNAHPDHLSIVIADNGPGMSESVKQKIFDPFFTTKSVGQGTGMGLSISHQIIVEKHGGQLNCYTAPGKGTEFVIELPTAALVTAKASSRSIVTA
ncbi:ammonium transporter [filamentous cyanobacterium LEGE 11480]|uniref:histidine kinase n=1 Tax=Romeriopsis navalis LEGE 11480 TaxID=2777977 RepID=A0A928VKS2_9CYAN|nr:ammonium transporter [Romeriopsis navalis]MBE9030381.1 ammonium transporter [Romeriopsis navalis LEGE 11480]